MIVAIRRAIACSWRAWHEVPGTGPPQKSRPVGYGVIRAGVRTDSMIGVTKFRIRKPKKYRIGFIKPFQTSETLLGTGLWRISTLVSRRHGPLHRAAARTSSDTNLSRGVFSLP